METFLYIVFFLSCIVLVVSVLLQPGKTDAGALFTSGVSKAALNPRGTQSVLSKLTIVTAAVFMLTALLLSLPALTGNVSVLQTQGENQTEITNTNANANVDANANANVTNTNAPANTDASSAPADNANAEDKGEETKEADNSNSEKSADKQEEKK